MEIIEQYAKALESRDYAGLAELFDRDGTIIDHCSNGTPQPEYHVYGKEAINMFFRNKFTFGKFSVRHTEIKSDRQVMYVASYGGYYVAALATIRRMTPDGKIERLSVRPK